MKRYNTVQEMLEAKDGKLISLYMTTYRVAPDSGQNPIRFKNMASELKKKITDFEHEEEILELLEDFQNNHELWEHTKDGFMLLISKAGYYQEHLRHDPGEKLTLGDSFNLLPYYKDQTLLENGYVLDLSKDRFEIYKLDGKELEEVDVDAKKHFEELFDDHDSRMKLNKGGDYAAGGGTHGMYDKSETDENEKLKYFRYIDKVLNKHLLQKGDILILACVKENRSLFKEISKYNGISEVEIEKPLSSIETKDMKEELLKVLSPLHEKKMRDYVDAFGEAKGGDRVELHPDSIKSYIEQGRVESLLINESKNRLTENDLNELVELGIETGANILVFEEEKELPALVAMLRY